VNCIRFRGTVIVHVGPAHLCMENGVSIYMWIAVEVGGNFWGEAGNFWGAKDFWLNFPNLARKVLGDFACKFFPSKIMKPFLG